MEDCIDLASALSGDLDVPDALKLYETTRRPTVKKVQSAAQTSLEWFENTEQYLSLEPLQFTYSLLTRSLRVTHENLRRRDPDFVAEVEDAYFDGQPPVFYPFETDAGPLNNRFVAQAPLPADGECFYDFSSAKQMYQLAPLLQSGAALVVLPRFALSDWANAERFDNFLSLLASVHSTSGATCSASLFWDTNAGSKFQPLDVLATEAWMRKIASTGVECVELDLSEHKGCGQMSQGGLNEDSYQKSSQPVVNTAALLRKTHKGLLSVRVSLKDWRVSVEKNLKTMSKFIGSLEASGVNLFSITSTNHPHKGQRLYQAELADQIKSTTQANVMVEGGLDSLDDMNSLVAAGRADLVRLEEALWYNSSFIRLASKRHRVPGEFPDHLKALSGYTPRSFS